MANGLDPSRMSRDEKSFLLYAETCCVDKGGLLVGVRMNADDHEAARMFVERGLMFFGRIPSDLLRGEFGSETHFVELTLAGWELAWQLRRERSHSKGPYATKVWQHPLTLARLRDSDRSGEAGETTKIGSTVGESAGPKDIAQSLEPLREHKNER